MAHSTSSSLLSPWDSLFSESTTRRIPRDIDLYAMGERSEDVILVESGAIVEIREDGSGVTHAVGLSGPGSLLGARVTANNVATSSMRAIALADCVVRTMKRGDFVHATLCSPDLSISYLEFLARRLETTRKLTESCYAPSISDHVLHVLQTIATTFGVDQNGASSIAVRHTILERMTGTPHRVLVAVVHELGSHGMVQIERDAVRWIL